MKINEIWSKVGGQKMKFSIVLAKKWVGKCPPCLPSSDAPVHTKTLLVLYADLRTTEFTWMEQLYENFEKC